MLESASAYIERQGLVLTIERESGMYKHYRSMPHGEVEEGETPEEAAVRETEEETGYKVRSLRHLTDYLGRKTSGDNVIIRVYECEITGGAEKPDMNPEWNPKKELLERSDVVPSLKKAIRVLS
jgi:8-oxo-dGTP pyrophosphatase MutT (NUDIX family)